MMRSDITQSRSEVHEHIKAIKANDEKVLKLFYQNNYPKIERYVLMNSGTVDEARDIYQEAFIAVWRNIQLSKFEVQDNTSLDRYLYQVAKNKWLDFLRSAKRKTIVPLTGREDGLAECVDLSEVEQQQITTIKVNFKRLGQQCKDILERFYYRKQSMRVIAEDMSWTEATAKNNKYRCLQKLRELLKTNKPNLG